METQWTGFTDEQLRRLKTSDCALPAIEQNTQKCRGNYNDTTHRTKAPPQRGKGRQALVHRQQLPAQGQVIDPNQMLSKPSEERRSVCRPDRGQTAPAVGSVLSRDGLEVKTEIATNDSQLVEKNSSSRLPDKPPINKTRTEGIVGETVQTSITDGSTKQEVVGKKEMQLGKELNEKEGLSRELSKLEQFQQQQREIEDENARKKTLLARAIADRKKKTQAEVNRLVYIQKELSKIEEFLTNDVNILRDKIEEASWKYSDARKRYIKAETEFIEAKLLLHKTSEQKEALTEHLCTIIRMNELRKAKKLEELVEKLEGGDVGKLGAEIETAVSEKPLPQLTSSDLMPILNDEVPSTHRSENVTGDEAGAPPGQSLSTYSHGESTPQSIPVSTLHPSPRIRDKEHKFEGQMSAVGTDLSSETELTFGHSQEIVKEDVESQITTGVQRS